MRIPERSRLRALATRGVAEELWAWFEWSVGWAPGRLGRLARILLYHHWLPSSINVGRYTTIKQPSKLSAGRRVGIGDFNTLSCGGGLTIGDDVLFGPYVAVFTDNHNFDRPVPVRLQGVTRRPVVIGAGVWIGAGSMILPGVEIGEMSVVAAGSVVTSSVPPRTLVGGCPARILRTLPAKDSGVSV